MSEKITPSLESSNGLFSLIQMEESFTGAHQSSHIGKMSTLSVCPERIKGWKKLIAASGSQDSFAHNEFCISVWIYFFLMRIGDFKSASFSYHISSQIGLSKLKQKHAGRKEGSVGMPSAQCCYFILKNWVLWTAMKVNELLLLFTTCKINRGRPVHFHKQLLSVHILHVSKLYKNKA